MSKQPLRVLSLDWDYFIDATMEQRMRLFPDGGNESLIGYLQDFIWASRYAENSELESIKVDHEAYEQVKNFIYSGIKAFYTKCVVWDSHKYLYDEIAGMIEDGQPIEVINVDFHHDLYENSFDTVDCGNWVNCLYESPTHKVIENPENSHYYWLKRTDSDDKTTDRDWFHTVTSFKELEDYTGVKFDMIYLCRSSVWSPPHLDKAFSNLYRWIKKNITPNVEINITGDRWDASFRGMIKQQRVMYDEAKRKFRENCKN